MQKEIERFHAEETNGNRYTVRCFQEFVKSDKHEAAYVLAGKKQYQTISGELLKEIDEFTFSIMPSGKVIYKTSFLKNIDRR